MRQQQAVTALTSDDGTLHCCHCWRQRSWGGGADCRLHKSLWSYLVHIRPAWLLSSQQTHKNGSPRGCAEQRTAHAGPDNSRRRQLDWQSQALRASPASLLLLPAAPRCHRNILVWIFAALLSVCSRVLPLACILTRIASRSWPAPKLLLRLSSRTSLRQHFLAQCGRRREAVPLTLPCSPAAWQMLYSGRLSLRSPSGELLSSTQLRCSFLTVSRSAPLSTHLPVIRWWAHAAQGGPDAICGGSAEAGQPSKPLSASLPA